MSEKPTPEANLEPELSAEEIREAFRIRGELTKLAHRNCDPYTVNSLPKGAEINFLGDRVDSKGRLIVSYKNNERIDIVYDTGAPDGANLQCVRCITTDEYGMHRVESITVWMNEWEPEPKNEGYRVLTAKGIFYQYEGELIPAGNLPTKMTPLDEEMIALYNELAGHTETS